MALDIEKVIDLTAYAGNPAPKVVSQLSIIHESSDGELVQYYIESVNHSQGDKKTYAIGVYDRESQSYSYNDYDEVTWEEPGQRICGNAIERLGVKAFPTMGAIAFYKLLHRKITRIVVPVNRKGNAGKAPVLAAVENPDGTVTFTVTPPEKQEYECYRIVMQSGIYEEDYITYETELTVPRPRFTGEYQCYAVGYGEEGQGVFPLSITDFFSSITGGQIAGWGLASLLLLLSLVQISPLKFNPWDRILAWLGQKLNGKALAELQKQVTTMWVNDHRHRLLTFARECRAGIEHSSDEWSNALVIADEYEVYCEKNHVANGIVKADTQFIRNLYQELSREHRI